MTEEKFEKNIKSLKCIAIIFCSFVTLTLIIRFAEGTIGYDIIDFILSFSLYLAIAIGCHNKKMYGPICGIIQSVLLITTFNTTSCIYGICILTLSINILRYMNKK